MKKFIVVEACNSKSGDLGVRDKERKPTTMVEVGNSSSKKNIFDKAINEYKKGNRLYFWKDYYKIKPINLLEVTEKECDILLIKNGSLYNRMQHTPFTHFYYIKENTIFLTDGLASQVLKVMPYKEEIKAVKTDIDTLNIEFIYEDTYDKLIQNLENMIKIYSDTYEFVNYKLKDYYKKCVNNGHFRFGSNEYIIPNEVIDYNKFSGNTGMVRGDSHKFTENDSFLHIDLVIN